MVFSSIIFLFSFLPMVLVLYYTVGKYSIGFRNLLLLAASLLFYAWGEPEYIWLLILSCLFNWAAAWLVDSRRSRAKFWLTVSVIGNLGVLFVMKYWDFVMGNLNSMFQTEIFPILNMALPIGISFYTFQAMSYVIDVYRKNAAVQKNPLYVALYISLFPQLVAGPIVRYNTVERQLLGRTHSWDRFSKGCVRFVQGLAKKLVLANSFVVIADNIFLMTRAGHTVMQIPVTLAWLGSFAYTFQIFFDFSAYSDMAIGLGQMFGFEFEENFRYPYISRSIGEFWRRWHISMGTWFREYVYIPLGGSRNGDGRMVRNLFIVWLLTGLWHGAGWNFLLWGMLNFLFIFAERLFDLEKREGGRIWRHIYTLLTVNLGWVLFRCEDFYQLQEYLGNMFWQNQNGFLSPYTWMFLKEYACLWLAGAVLCMPVGEVARGRFKKAAPGLERALYPAGMMALLIISVVYLAKSGYNPFIYFNF